MASRQPTAPALVAGGRPRNRHIDTAVLDATLAVLNEVGYTALSLEDVARRAATTRPAIYRRWSGRPRLVLAALAVRLDVPELHAEFMAILFDPPRAAVARMLDRATARGDLRSDIDRELILDMLGSLIHYRTLFGHAPTSDTEVEHAIEALLAGIATDYPALVEHSRQLEAQQGTHPTHI